MSCFNRRHFLASSMGLGSVALTHLLYQDGLIGAPIRPDLEPRRFDLTPKAPHFAPKAKAMIYLFMQGGPSHVDMLDPKPTLSRMDGRQFPGTLKLDSPEQSKNECMGSPYRFRKHGQSGIEMSELLPHLGTIADELTLVRSMHTGVNNHVQSIVALNSGRIQAGRPVLGSWLTYALGTESQNLPAYVALTDPASLPVNGVFNWTNGWLPSLFQGTPVRPKEPRIPNLDPPPHLKGAAQERYLSFLGQLNREHLEQRPYELDLEARISSYELAARMQTSASEALDLSQETQATKRKYGMEDPACADFGARCLIARRLVERGVRFVQVMTANQFWDHHTLMASRLPAACKKIDQPMTALVTDLKTRGLLDETLVAWGGEMGRLPVAQVPAGGGRERIGRDHNTYGFTMWFAGGGVKKGFTYGNTDEFGHHAVENVVNHFDYHATLLHLFGLDHKKLSFQRNNQEMTLTDGQEARVVHEILA